MPFDYSELYETIESGLPARIPESPYWHWVHNCEPSPEDDYWADLHEWLKTARQGGRPLSTMIHGLLVDLPERWMQQIAMIVAARFLWETTYDQEIQDAPIPNWDFIEAELADGQTIDFRIMDNGFFQPNPLSDLALPAYWAEWLEQQHPNADLTNYEVLQHIPNPNVAGGNLEEALTPGVDVARMLDQALLLLQFSAEDQDVDSADISMRISELAWAWAQVMVKRLAFDGAFFPFGPMWEGLRINYFRRFLFQWWKLVACKFPWVQKLNWYGGDE